MNLIVWENEPSMHTYGAYDILNKNYDIDVSVLSQNRLDKRRREIGWEEVKNVSYNHIVTPSKPQIRQYLKMAGVHLLVGIKSYSLPSKALASLKSKPVIVYSESYRTNTFSKPLKIIRTIYRSIVYKQIRGILAIGDDSYHWFKKYWLREIEVYPFKYWVRDNGLEDRKINDETNIVFVGRFIKSKGIENLIEVLIDLKKMDWKAHIVGDGSMFKRIKKNIEKYGLKEKVKLYGSLPNTEVRKIMRNSDILVHPSHYDGWGAVISEAILSGMRVICTKESGASVIANNLEYVKSYESKDIEQLNSLLENEIKRGPSKNKIRWNIYSWGKNNLSYEAGAKNMQKIIQHILKD